MDPFQGSIIKKAMSVLHFSKDNFETQVLKNEQPVIVDFWATWCRPCRLAAPVIDELAQEYEGKIVVGKVNVEESPNLAQKYGVMSIPTILIFKNGQELNRQVGFPGKEEYEKMIKKALGEE